MKQRFHFWKIFLNASRHTSRIDHITILIAKILICSYQLLISPLFGSVCRFSPSCSQYTLEAIDRHGLIKGSVMAVKRLMRCHPWNSGGYDPVP